MTSLDDDYRSLRELAEKATYGPWGWFGNQFGVYLATPDPGRLYIMRFERFGMRGAQPTFRSGAVMRPAADLVKFAVGDGRATGFKEGKADPSVYRYDIIDIDCPDARFIAAANPATILSLLDRLEAVERALEWCVECDDRSGSLPTSYRLRIEEALEAISGTSVSGPINTSHVGDSHE